MFHEYISCRLCSRAAQQSHIQILHTPVHTYRTHRYVYIYTCIHVCTCVSRRRPRCGWGWSDECGACIYTCVLIFISINVFNVLNFLCVLFKDVYSNLSKTVRLYHNIYFTTALRSLIFCKYKTSNYYRFRTGQQWWFTRPEPKSYEVKNYDAKIK